jgi:hypothetical protein
LGECDQTNVATDGLMNQLAARWDPQDLAVCDSRLTQCDLVTYKGPLQNPRSFHPGFVIYNATGSRACDCCNNRLHWLRHQTALSALLGALQKHFQGLPC